MPESFPSVLTNGTLSEASRVPGESDVKPGSVMPPGGSGIVPTNVAEAVDTPKIPNKRPAAASMHNDL